MSVLLSGLKILSLSQKEAIPKPFFLVFWESHPGGEVEATDRSLGETLNHECLEEIEISFDSSLFKLLSENIILKNQKPKLYLTFATEIFKKQFFNPGAEVEEIRLSLYEDFKDLHCTPTPSN